MCQVLKVSRSAFYEWLNRPLGRRQEQDIIYLAKITEIFNASMAIEGLKNSSEKKGLSVAKTG